MKKLLSLLICLGLLLSLCCLPVLADAEDAPIEEAPAEDGWGIEANVFYYDVDPDSVKSPVLMYMEYVEPGGHPENVPVWTEMSWTWYLTPELTGEPVDPTAFVINELGEELHFYGYLDAVSILLHMPEGSDWDIFAETFVNRGSTFDADAWGELPTGCWAAAWADADGNIIDTANTPLWEDTDLYALAGAFQAVYMYVCQQIGGEGFLEPGTLQHIPTSYLAIDIVDGHIVQTRYDIIGWTDENGNPVDPASVTVTEDRVFYAVLEGEDFPDPKPEGHDLPDPAPVVTIDEAGAMATVSGDFSGLYARAALVLDNNGLSGLYLTQVEINPDGRIVVPAFMVPGLTVKGVNIALVPTLDDITSPKPEVIASAFRMIG